MKKIFKKLEKFGFDVYVWSGICAGIAILIIGYVHTEVQEAREKKVAEAREKEYRETSKDDVFNSEKIAAAEKSLCEKTGKYYAENQEEWGKIKKAADEFSAQWEEMSEKQKDESAKRGQDIAMNPDVLEVANYESCVESYVKK